MSSPFLIHKCNLEKWRPRAYDVKKEYADPSQAKYEVASIYKMYDKNDPDYPGGHNLNLEIQFGIRNDQLHPDVNLPTDAGSEIYLEFYDKRPDESQIKGFIMMFEVLRKNYVPVEKKILRDGSDAKVMTFRFNDSDSQEYYGYKFILKIKYNEPSSRGKALIDQGKVCWVVLVEGARQTTLDQFT